MSDSDLRSCLRSLARKERDVLRRSERSRASLHIAELVCALAEVNQAKSILLYSAFRSEVETDKLCRRLLQVGKVVCLPLTRPEEKDLVPIMVQEGDFPLAPGYQGIPEPTCSAGRVFQAEHLDIVVVPGLLFDRNGYRLGYGGGYYDRFLAQKASQALRIGLAFSCQVRDSIPVQSHDMPLDILVTEEEVLRWPEK